jgi:EmrB/QacA subfamily drug resistance transporter
MATLRYGEAAGRWVLLATVLGSGVAFIDATVVGIALPRIAVDLGADAAALQWTVNGYTLTLAALILVAGSLGDRYGRRRVFLVGVGWFAVASLLCGLAPDAGLLVAARTLQGVGGALLTPGSLAILQASFHPDDRSRAIGAWSGLGGIAGAAAPFLGGWILEVSSWRWIFLINLPICAAVLAVGLRHVPESSDPDASPHLDVPGTVLGALGLAGLTYGLTAWPERGAGDAVVLGALTAGVLGLAAFVLVEHRSPHPVVPLAMFRSRALSATNVVTFLVYAALSGVFFFLAITLQVVAGYSPLGAGIASLPATVLMLLLSARGGALGDRIGPRIPMTAGPLVCGAGVLLLAPIGAGEPYVTGVLPGVTLLGLGLCLVVAPLTTTALASAEDRHVGVASGVNNAVARAAGLIAIAALPLLAGLGTSLVDATTLAPAHRTSMLVCAGLMAAGGLLAAATIPSSFAEVRAGAVRTAPGGPVAGIRRTPAG